MNSDDWIPISALNHYLYCPRRCYLIHVEREFLDNIFTQRGSQEHERVDQQRHEMSAGVRVEYGLPVWSERLRLLGRCDAVEFHLDGSVYPVEHKHGKRRSWINDDLQVAAQALCLEEMLQQKVPCGAIFHQRSKRRREVQFTPELRVKVEKTVADVCALLSQNRRPPPVADCRCPNCSLIEICMPSVEQNLAVLLAVDEVIP